MDMMCPRICKDQEWIRGQHIWLWWGFLPKPIGFDIAQPIFRYDGSASRRFGLGRLSFRAAADVGDRQSAKFGNVVTESFFQLGQGGLRAIKETAENLSPKARDRRGSFGSDKGGLLGEGSNKRDPSLGSQEVSEITDTMAPKSASSALASSGPAPNPKRAEGSHRAPPRAEQEREEELERRRRERERKQRRKLIAAGTGGSDDGSMEDAPSTAAPTVATTAATGETYTELTTRSSVTKSASSSSGSSSSSDTESADRSGSGQSSSTSDDREKEERRKKRREKKERKAEKKRKKAEEIAKKSEQGSSADSFAKLAATIAGTYELPPPVRKRNRHEYAALFVLHPLFENFVLCCVVLQSIFIAMQHPLANPNEPGYLLLNVFSLIFAVLFTLEMILKMLAFGLFKEGVENRYLDDNPWARDTFEQREDEKESGGRTSSTSFSGSRGQQHSRSQSHSRARTPGRLPSFSLGKVSKKVFPDAHDPAYSIGLSEKDVASAMRRASRDVAMEDFLRENGGTEGREGGTSSSRRRGGERGETTGREAERSRSTRHREGGHTAVLPQPLEEEEANLQGSGDEAGRAGMEVERRNGSPGVATHEVGIFLNPDEVDEEERTVGAVGDSDRCVVEQMSGVTDLAAADLEAGTGFEASAPPQQPCCPSPTNHAGSCSHQTDVVDIMIPAPASTFFSDSFHHTAPPPLPRRTHYEGSHHLQGSLYDGLSGSRSLALSQSLAASKFHEYDPTSSGSGTRSRALGTGSQSLSLRRAVKRALITTTDKHRPLPYFMEGWNWFDFFIVLTCWGDEVGGWVGSTNSSVVWGLFAGLRTFRLLRAFRPLKLVSRNRNLRILVDTIAKMVPELLNLFIVSAIVCFVFAVWGMSNLKGAFGYCGDKNLQPFAFMGGSSSSDPSSGGGGGLLWLDPSNNYFRSGFGSSAPAPPSGGTARGTQAHVSYSRKTEDTPICLLRCDAGANMSVAGKEYCRTSDVWGYNVLPCSDCARQFCDKDFFPATGSSPGAGHITPPSPGENALKALQSFSEGGPNFNSCVEQCHSGEIPFFCDGAGKGTFECLQQCTSACLCDACQGFVLDAGKCVEQGGKWLNPFQNFDNIGSALQTVIEVGTLESVVSTTYSAIDHVGPYRAPERGKNSVWTVFFVVVVLFGSFFVLNLAVGSVIDQFKRVRAVEEAKIKEEEAEEAAKRAAAAAAADRAEAARRPSKEVSGEAAGDPPGEDAAQTEARAEDGAEAESSPGSPETNKIPIRVPSSESLAHTAGVALTDAQLGMIHIYRRLDLNMQYYLLNSLLRLPEPPLKGIVQTGATGSDMQNLRRKALILISRWQFEMTVLTLIVANTVILSLQIIPEPEAGWNENLNVAEIAFVCLFNLEAMVKIFAMQLGYFSMPWNRFDFVCVVAGDLGLIMGGGAGGAASLSEETNESSVLLASAVVLRVFRICRLLRFLKFLKGLSRVFSAFVLSIPKLMNTVLLLSILFFAFTVLGQQLFARTKQFGAHNEHANFQTFGNGFMTLFRCATGDGWNQLLHAFSADEFFFKTILEEPCSPDPMLLAPENNYAFYKDKKLLTHPIECGNATVAVAYFLGFQFVVGVVLLNLFVAVVFDAYEESVKQHQVNALWEVAEECLKQRSWQAYDPEMTGY